MPIIKIAFPKYTVLFPRLYQCSKISWIQEQNLHIILFLQNLNCNLIKL